MSAWGLLTGTNHRLESCSAWHKTRGTELKLEKLH